MREIDRDQYRNRGRKKKTWTGRERSGERGAVKKNEKKSVKRNTREERVERQSKGNIYEEKDRDRDKERQSVVFSATFGCCTASSCDIIISKWKQ